eukprot:gene30104-36361_t
MRFVLHADYFPVPAVHPDEHSDPPYTYEKIMPPRTLPSIADALLVWLDRSLPNIVSSPPPPRVHPPAPPQTLPLETITSLSTTNTTIDAMADDDGADAADEVASEGESYRFRGGEEEESRQLECEGLAGLCGDDGDGDGYGHRFCYIRPSVKLSKYSYAKLSKYSYAVFQCSEIPLLPLPTIHSSHLWEEWFFTLPTNTFHWETPWYPRLGSGKIA